MQRCVLFCCFTFPGSFLASLLHKDRYVLCSNCTQIYQDKVTIFHSLYLFKCSPLLLGLSISSLLFYRLTAKELSQLKLSFSQLPPPAPLILFSTSSSLSVSLVHGSIFCTTVFACAFACQAPQELEMKTYAIHPFLYPPRTVAGLQELNVE